MTQLPFTNPSNKKLSGVGTSTATQMSNPRGGVVLPKRIAALGLRASAMPSMIYVLVGFILGPESLDILSSEILGHLDPAVSIGLAALGVFVGLGLGSHHARTTRWALLAATIGAVITAAVIAITMYTLFQFWELDLPSSTAIFAFSIGICGCASAAASLGYDIRPHRHIAARIAELEDVPLIILGGLAVTLASAGIDPFGQMRLAIIASLAISIAGWLLFERARSDAERAVFVTGAIALLGGLPAFIGASPLVSGVVAGLVWVYIPGSADRIIASDLRKLQQPLVPLLLIVAGASIQLNPLLLWITVPLVLFRLSGKLIASTAAARIVGAPAAFVGTVLVPPGAIGIAIALNIQQVVGTGDTILVSSIIMAAVTSEILAVALLTVKEEWFN